MSSGRQETPGSISEVVRALAREHLEVIIAGGVAAQLYGGTRVTMDLDLIPNLKSKPWQALLAKLGALGFRPVDATLAQIENPTGLRKWARGRGSVALRMRREHPPLSLDLLVQAGEHFGYYRARCHAASDEGSQVLIVAKEDLIEMKRATGRPKDLLDIAELEASK